MTETPTRPIWNPETGITDLEADPASLAASEIPGIRAIWSDQQERLMGTAQLLRFTEQMNREWAIETGIIENLYDISRGVTQTLIEQGFRADLLSHGSTNKPQRFVIQVLRDQKDALDGIFDFVKGNRSLSTSYIKELHLALLRSQKTTDGMDTLGRDVEIDLIRGAWKKQANNPAREGVTYTYCPPEQVDSEMDRLIAIHSSHIQQEVPSEVQAAWLHHRLTQIHPFQDGNGRVARAIASLVLVRNGLFPLVVTRDDRARYIDALERADQGDIKALIDLIVKRQRSQFRKANSISNELLATEDTQAALGGLLRAADRIAAEKLAELRGVFDLAHIIEDDLKSRLNLIAPEISEALRRVSDNGTAFVDRSKAGTDYYFRAQIIENAKHHIGYFADTSVYREWVSLRMRWSRFGQLVFAIHGIGKPFNGSLICAPFLEFKDTDDEGETRNTFIPLAEEGFVFFYNERHDGLLSRFVPWRESVLMVALSEVTQNL